MRLTAPLVRDNGTLRPASWNEALDRVETGFRRALTRKKDDGEGANRLDKSATYSLESKGLHVLSSSICCSALAFEQLTGNVEWRP